MFFHASSVLYGFIDVAGVLKPGDQLEGKSEDQSDSVMEKKFKK